MQHALQFMHEGTDSSQESRCRIALIRNGLPCPKVNWKVRLNNGKIALLDMAYPDIKVAIEYDGRHHAGQWLADSKRREALEDDGWAYIQVTAENLMNDFEKTGTRATSGRPDEPTIKQAHHALSKNALGKDTHPHNVSRQWKQKDSHLKATICGRFAIPRQTKTAICGRPDRFQASKDPNQYPLDEIFLGILPHITEIIFLKCQKLPHIGHFKLKTRHRHITFSSDRRQHFENVIIIDDEAIDFAAAEFAQPFVGFRIGERTDVEMQRLVPSDHHLVSIHSLDRPVEMGKGTIRNIQPIRPTRKACGTSHRSFRTVRITRGTRTATSRTYAQHRRIRVI